MSSRALRKLHREREQQKYLDTPDQDGAQDYESEGEAFTPKVVNAFDVLNVNEGEEADDSRSRHPGGDDEDADESMQVKLTTSEKPKAKKSKKKKNRNKAKESQQSEPLAKNRESSQLDEIDLALKALSSNSGNDTVDSSQLKINEANAQLYRLLTVESKHLNALNEMKRLFGNVVLENEDQDTGTPRRGGRQQTLDLGGALSARNSPASRGQGLAGLVLRRNPFILGKEEWPKVTSGGLGMELEEKLDDGTTEYRFVHNTMYQDVQRQFETCVESMDPQRMISMLQYNPYHISTLLQVSEIAKQQADHSVSGDLLERALFNFGRSVHSSFTTALTEGKARLQFARPENREFWLSSWRYINNLGQRGTWRTAYEWAKLLLSLDPELDPYRVCLVIDQLALRGGQAEHFLQLSRCPFFADDLWRQRPNIQISSALAEYKLKRPEECRASLGKCLKDYPWIFARLFQELNIDHIPKSIWGKSPATDRDKFDCEVYVHYAKDLWNTPEAISFLVEVAEAVDVPHRGISSKDPISLEEARHILLSGVPSLINLIPREFTNMSTSSSDPLPPTGDENNPSYDPSPMADWHSYQSPFEPPDSIETTPEEGTPNPRSPEDHERDVAEAQELRGLQGFFRGLIPWLGSRQAPEGSQVEAIQRHAAEHGIPDELIAAQGGRAMELLRREAELNQPATAPNETEAVPQIHQEDGEEENESPLQTRTAHAANVESDPEEEAAGSNTPAAPEPYDNERNQRWLAGQGLLRLRDFTTQHGTDETAWSASAGQDIVTEYALRLMQQRQQRQREFILNYTLRQGTSLEVTELVKREIERVGE